ncbi:enoyl-CoA hydratase [Chryseomicrobium palamuruense]|uniref:Enoyl-CoA hydratase n=1 Tax=Chryseomicrobium palamuruense TaxID=682973 RepID=A0ABV8URV3_9BACL
MSYQTLEVTKEKHVITVTLNRPDALNSMNGQMIQELRDCFTSLLNEKDAQILILKGSGRAFSAGGDIKAMLANDGSFEMKTIMKQLEELALAYYSLPMLTIASVHGAAAGLGYSLVLASDFIVAEKSAKLAMNFIGIGLVPDGGGHFFLKERTGIPGAKHIIWQGKMMTGDEAHAAKLIDQVAEDGTLQDTTNALVKHLSHSPVEAMISSKQILHGTKMDELKSVLAEEAKVQTNLRTSEDHLEGIDAFVSKRKPFFNQ